MLPRLAACSNSSSLAATASAISRVVSSELDSHPPARLAELLTDDPNVLVLMKALSQVQNEATEVYESVCAHALHTLLSLPLICTHTVSSLHSSCCLRTSVSEANSSTGSRLRAFLAGKRLVSASSSLYANGSSRLSTRCPRRLSRISFRQHSCWRPNPITCSSRRMWNRSNAVRPVDPSARHVGLSSDEGQCNSCSFAPPSRVERFHGYDFDLEDCRKGGEGRSLCCCCRMVPARHRAHVRKYGSGLTSKVGQVRDA